jgi:hypothetical protein
MVTLKMKIQHYSFGEISVNGKTYQNDVLIFPDKVQEWWRDDCHCLKEKDILDVLDFKPDFFVVGQGSECLMLVPLTCEDDLKVKNITLIYGNTEDMVKKFNELVEQGKKVIGAFHLTC